MEKFAHVFFSMRMMALAMLVFLLAIGTATFIESFEDIQTAKIWIYNAKWFEILLVYLTINLIANIFKFQMYKREKIAMFSFHLSFIIIIIGAGITRYQSFEGLMLIREGEQSNVIYSADPHLWYKINDGQMQYTNSHKAFMSPVADNDFSYEVAFPKHQHPIQISYVNFQKKVIDSLVVDPKIDDYVLDIVTDGMKSNYLSKDGFVMVGDVAISFEKKDAMPGIILKEENGSIFIKSALPLRRLPMTEMAKYRQSGINPPDSAFVEIPKDTYVPFVMKNLYNAESFQFVYKQKLEHAKKMWVPSNNKKVGKDILTVKITDGNQSKIVDLIGGMGIIPEHEVFSFNGLVYEMEYGSTKIELPFSIACRDFQLDRYPGSNTASSFASEVTIIDEPNQFKKDQRIFMNNVMDYQGYRFFQSSYDEDEKGTRLSVNYDWWGTNVTYLGYLLLAIGMLLSLFAKEGRFRILNDLIKKSAEKRKLLTLVVLWALSPALFFAQEGHEGHDHAKGEVSHQKETPIHRVISEEHSNELASLLVQGYDGRIEPVHTLFLELLRKVNRHDHFEGKNAVQTMMSMHMYPQYWMTVKIISVPSNLREKLKVGEYASYEDLVDQHTGQFKLIADYNNAHQRLESKRDEYDKKLIKLVERFEVVQSIFNWSYMKIMPVKKDPNQTWFIPLSMELMSIDSTSSQLALKYISSLDQSSISGNFSNSANLLKSLKKFQRSEGEKVVPTEKSIQIEVSYNKMNIFKNAYRSYLLIGLVLLFIFFFKIFVKPSERNLTIFKWVGKVFMALLIVIFVYHGSGLAMRWYLSGHAPWSNGYEAVVFIAWVTMIAGFSFAKKNPVVIAGTAILAALMIFVSDMNLLDPEITPLQPVLKSYWLMIHVAIITGSYGFLGLGAILGLFNLILYIFRGKQNGKLVTLHISEITYVSEMTITIGLFMLTIGTFLGGIWANESWGRYWGWDPKETWALVSVLVYAVILHLRYIPALKGKFTFNLVSFWGYSSILFTFFGVNFILTGLHSYAQGDGAAQMPNFVYVLISVFFFISLIAWFRNKSYQID